jgi:DNA-binding CsgD family transcriptional regulator/PAS domain-containing protein
MKSALAIPADSLIKLPGQSEQRSDTESLSNLVGEIYDAALDQGLWGNILEKCTEFLGGSAAALFSKDVTTNRGNSYYDFGIDPYYRQLYFEKYVTLDPLTTGHFFADIEQPISTVDLIAYDEFLETRFYLEWARPQGLVDFVTAPLDKSVTSIAMFGVFRHERDGQVDEETRRRMRLIVPHVRRAALIGRLFDLQQAETASFSEILDGLSAGVILVDGRGRIVHANEIGHAMLNQGDLLHSVGDNLVVTDPGMDQALREDFAAADEGDVALGVRGIAFPLLSRNDERHVGHLLPLTSGARRRAGAGYAAAAALFVRKAVPDTPLPPELIAKTYNLTPAELRVLLAIVEVGGVPESAAALGVAVTTVKTHLGRLFEKTGVGRQADLVKLVAGYSMPLAG